MSSFPNFQRKVLGGLGGSQWFLVEKDMATHSSALVWGMPGTGSLVGCRLGGHTESDTTEAT